MPRQNLFTSKTGGLKTTGMEDYSDESEEVNDEDDSGGDSRVLQSEVLSALDEDVFANPPTETKVEVWVNNYFAYGCGDW